MSKYAKSDESAESDLSDPKWSRAQSPLPERYANMSPEELERILGIEIPRAPLLTDHARSFFGFKTNPRYNPDDLLHARRAAKSRIDRAEAAMQKAADEQKAVKSSEAARIRYQAKADAAAEAARARAKFHPITQADIAAARMNYENWRVAADRSATTHRPVSPENAYDVLGEQRDAARERLEKLQREFEDQERMTPGAQFFVPSPASKLFFGPPPKHKHKGGKSKRVKSKRNKQNTKRRNTRK